MFTIRDHFSSASQANVEAQIELGKAVGEVWLNGSRQLLDLHAGVIKASLQELEEVAGELIATDTPLEFASVALAQVQPAVGKTLAYQCHASRIGVAMHAQMLDVLDTRVAATNREIIAFVADVSKHAPADADRVVVIFRRWYENANARYERISQATRKMLGTLVTSLNSAGNQLAQMAHEGRSYQGVHF